MMAATFGDRHAFFAERAFFRLVGRNGEVEQRIYLFLRYAEVCFAAASASELSATWLTAEHLSVGL